MQAVYGKGRGTMSDHTTDPVSGDNTTDILFDCPVCGKSLEIDARGAGYVVVCPDCKHEVEVPVLDPAEDSPGGLDAANEIVNRLQAQVEQLQRIAAADQQCLRRIGDEMQLIQAALDRINEMIETRLR